MTDEIMTREMLKSAEEPDPKTCESWERECTCCEKHIKGKMVMLELDQRIGEYHDFENVPEDKSQGGFWFGSGCAKRARAKAKAELHKQGIKTP